MKLKCTTGSISCDGVLAEKGDVFEVSDEAGESLIKSGDAILQEESAPQADEPEPIPEPEPEPTFKPPMDALVDLSAMNKSDTLELVESTNDPDVIQAYLEQEQVGKNRQNVIDALESKLQI